MDQFVTLGRTGFRVSRLGLGGGGNSRLGQNTNRSEQDSVNVVRRALDLGINFIDTAESYGTEEIIGRAVRDAGKSRAREQIVISTKKSLWTDTPLTAADLRAGLERSLTRLQTDYIDVYHLHGLRKDQYDYARENLVPEMLKFKQQGKIRAVGATEGFNSDPGHAMFQRSLRDNDDDCWDVIMIGFNILNQSARQRVLIETRRKNIGVLCMFAVRSALSQPAKLRETVAELRAAGRLADPSSIDAGDPLGFLTRADASTGVAPAPATSIVDAAYRFCRDEPGIHVVLSGTGNVAHLEENLAAMSRPPLPEPIHQRLMQMFEGVDSVTGQ